MSPSGSAAAWHLPARPARTWRKTLLKGLGVGLAALTIAQYLAGFLFLWSAHLNSREATPLTIARYAYYYGARAEVHSRLIVTSAVGVAVVMVCALTLLLPRRRSLHGDAGFATRREVAAAGLLGEHGVSLGRIGRRCVMLSGQQGVALAAPPRAGKGTGVVVPNALNWPGSLVCVDIKRENWTLTAGGWEGCGPGGFLFYPFLPQGSPPRRDAFSFPV